MRRAVLCVALAMSASVLATGPSAAAVEPVRNPLALVDCGKALPKPGGGTWECTFADEFTGTSLDRTKWLPQVYHGSGSPIRACFVDRPDTISVGDGTLKLTVRKVTTPV